MKKLSFLIMFGILITLVSCFDKPKSLEKESDQIIYPIYRLYEFEYIPDSSKSKYLEFIKESIRASNQNLTAGDYEDVDDVIDEIKDIADETFSVKVMGFHKYINSYEYIDVKPENMNEYEKHLLDSLTFK